MPTNFVQIASYRDADLVALLLDRIAKAAHPENLRFGICCQHDESWARNAIQSLYTNETYSLQLDSHDRFIPGWGAGLIEMLESLA